MSIISFCVIIIELDDGEKESRKIESLTYHSNIYDEMTSKGKGIPVLLNSQGTRVNVNAVAGQRKPQEVTVSTFIAFPGPDTNLTLEDKAEAVVSIESKHFVSGNPFVEVTKGILHLYKDNDRLYMEPGSNAPRSEMLCVMAIPSTISCSEFLNFVSPFKTVIEQIKIIRDNSPNHYMAVLKFNDQSAADQFYHEYNGKQYNSFEDPICLLAYVSRIETLNQNDGAGHPLTGHTELPTCPVCLERMDESVEGLLTILCNHSFHTSCLIQWSDNGCPVCRYVQTPEMVNKNFCVECNSKDQVWICLICGHVGCGRYIQGHAFKHYCETGHNYAIQPDNNRVWDYVGDTFVHRLFQSKVDGKVVDASGSRYEGQVTDPEEKADHIQLEFTHLLTSQLDAQRKFFEENMKTTELEHKAALESVITKLHVIETEKLKNEERVKELVHENRELGKKQTKAQVKYERTAEKLEEELVVVKTMTQDLSFCKNRLAEVEKKYEHCLQTTAKEIQELQETVRDLSIYIQTEKAIADSPYATEVSQGSISVPTPPPNAASARGKKKRGSK